MKRLDIYGSVLAASYSMPRETVIEQLESFIRQNGRWRRHFQTEVAFEEEATLTANLMDQKVGLLGWLLVCGAVSPTILDGVQRHHQQCKAA